MQPVSEQINHYTKFRIAAQVYENSLKSSCIMIWEQMGFHVGAVTVLQLRDHIGMQVCQTYGVDSVRASIEEVFGQREHILL
jgi:hypothetical protein